MQYPPKKLHYKPFTLNIIVYICIQNKISNNPIHVGLYAGFGGINQLHLLIINYLSSKYYQNTYHSCFLAWKFSLLQMVTLVTPHGNSIYMLR